MILGQRAECPSPTTLAAMRDCYRPLLVFSASSQRPLALQQLRMLNADELRERNVLLVLVSKGDFAGHARDLPSVPLSEDENKRLRQRFKVSDGEFAVILVGKDGGEKLRRARPVLSSELNATIDAMPMRKREMAGTIRKSVP